MALIVKPATEAMARPAMDPPPTRYEFFTTEVVKDITEKDVTIPKSIGWYTVEQLEREKADLQARIDSIDEKLLAISSL